MHIDEAKKIVRADMDRHGLTQWKLIVVDSKSMAGWCQTRFWHKDSSRSMGTIALSRPYMEAFDTAHVKEVGLHEIAHALDEPSNQAHGPKWKAIARRIGSTGDRCVSVDAPKIKSRYTGKCDGGHEFAKHRKTWNMEHNGYWCPKCTRATGKKGRIEWVDNTTGRRIGSTMKTTLPMSTPPAPVQTPAPVAAMSKPKLKAPRVVKTPTTWKDKFDQGMTSFGDDW